MYWGTTPQQSLADVVTPARLYALALLQRRCVAAARPQRATDISSAAGARSVVRLAVRRSAPRSVHKALRVRQRRARRPIVSAGDACRSGRGAGAIRVWFILVRSRPLEAVTTTLTAETGAPAAHWESYAAVLRASVLRTACLRPRGPCAALQLVGGAARPRAVAAPRRNVTGGPDVVYRTRAAPRRHLARSASQDFDNAASNSAVRRCLAPLSARRIPLRPCRVAGPGRAGRACERTNTRSVQQP